MKTIWKAEKAGKVMYFAANLTVYLVRLEKQFNCKVEPTGFMDIESERSYFYKYNIKILDFQGIKKALKAMN